MEAVAKHHERDTNETACTEEADEVSQVRAIATIEAAGATDIGRVRAKNEDRLSIVPEMGLCVVADGLGGHVAGGVAAEMAVQEIHDYIRRGDTDPTPDEDGSEAPRVSAGLLAQAVQHANRAIHAASRSLPDCQGMGTTVAALLLVRGFAFLAHVGDSRIYRFRDGRLRRLTDDHSLAAEHIRQKGTEADPGFVMRSASTLTRCLGAVPTIEVTLHVERTEPGDLYLLCSDGLWGALDESVIARLLWTWPDLQEAADALIRAANHAGGHDNITAILARPLFAGPEQPRDLSA